MNMRMRGFAATLSLTLYVGATASTPAHTQTSASAAPAT